LLKDMWASKDGEELDAKFVSLSGKQPTERQDSNSPASTVRSLDSSGIDVSDNPSSTAVMAIIIPADVNEELMHGEAPGHDLKKPVPFILVRKQGTDVRFTAVLSPQTDLKVRQTDEHQNQTTDIIGADFSDHVSGGSPLTVEQQTQSSR
jgi:hypothetical protein